jgi:hypothetical protein
MISWSPQLFFALVIAVALVGTCFLWRESK